jgi:mannose-6-phosphate isomerase-like protein (cupin superfamily)
MFIDNDLTDHNANWLFNYVPKGMLEFCEDQKLIPTKASIFKEHPQDASQTRPSASQTPHINAGNEVHFFFADSHIIYFNIHGEHLSLIVQSGDWLLIPANIEHWIKATADHYLVIASYHSEPFDLLHSKVKYTTTKSQAFL